MKKLIRKIIKFIKKNKLLSVGILIFLILFILIIISIKILIFPGSKKGGYGDRLNGIENVRISSNILDTLKEKVKEKEGITVEKYKISGKIINIFLKAENLETKTAKEYSNTLLECFKEEELKFYDIQIYVTSENNESYPIIGYKNANSEGLSWNYEGGK